MTTQAHNAKVNAERGAMDLVKLIEQFADEDRCRTHLEQLRWPSGVRCPRCEGDKVKAIQSVTRYRRDTVDGHKKGEIRAKRSQFDCSCGYQFSVKSGTVLQDSKLPLWKWFLAVYLMCESKKGMSANQLKRTLGVSYEAAWFLCHRIRSAMIGDGEPLSGIVEADETYIGGKVHTEGTRSEQAKARFRNKTVVLGAIERGGKLRVRAVAGHNAQRGTVRQFLNDSIEDADALYTDSHKVYQGIKIGDARHESVNHSAEEYVRGDVHTNTIESAWSLFDRAVIGSYHQLSEKHLPAYLREFEFRFNNRDNPFLFRDTLIALLRGETLTYDELTAEE